VYYGEPLYVAAEVHKQGQKVRMQAVVTRADSRLQSSQPWDEIAAALEADVDQVKASTIGGTAQIQSFEELMAVEDAHQPWVIKGTLRGREIMCLTGQEGCGKSMLFSQIVLGAACGVNTFASEPLHFEPRKVMVVDAENTALQIRDNYEKIWPAMQKQIEPGFVPDLAKYDEGYLDLAKPIQRTRLIRHLVNSKADLIYLGTVYKLTSESDYEAQFHAIRAVVDEVREETGAAFLIENHSPHERNPSGDRVVRPYGSSMWLRWPNFGVGIREQSSTDGSRLVSLTRWRGDRTRERIWPSGFRESKGLPWMPVHADEWEVVAA
jgi:RecA-family ATPase